MNYNHKLFTAQKYSFQKVITSYYLRGYDQIACLTQEIEVEVGELCEGVSAYPTKIFLRLSK